MFRRAYRLATLALLVITPGWLYAQSDTPEPSLGEVARNMRKEKAAARPVIDNDNLSTVMSDAEANRLKGKMIFSLDGSGKDFQVSSPDATCSLSFSTHARSLVISRYVPQEIPASELSKLDGPAVINSDTLEVSVHNATNWSISEITVGVTILRSAAPADASQRLRSKIVWAAEVTPLNAQKLSDVTVLHHLKGSAEPSGTAVFREVLTSPISSDQDWHWAIVEAKGVPAQTGMPTPAEQSQPLAPAKSESSSPPLN